MMIRISKRTKRKRQMTSSTFSRCVGPIYSVTGSCIVPLPPSVLICTLACFGLTSRIRSASLAFPPSFVVPFFFSFSVFPALSAAEKSRSACCLPSRLRQLLLRTFPFFQGRLRYPRHIGLRIDPGQFRRMFLSSSIRSGGGFHQILRMRIDAVDPLHELIHQCSRRILCVKTMRFSVIALAANRGSTVSTTTCLAFSGRTAITCVFHVLCSGA